MNRKVGIAFVVLVVVALAVVAAVLIGKPKPAAPPWAGPGLEQSGAAPAYQLDLIEGRYTLPDTNLPLSFTSTSEFVIDSMRSTAGKRLQAFVAELPFHVPDTAKRFKPVGMRVFVGDEEIPFSTSSGSGSSWRIQQQQLLLTHRVPPKPGSVRIVHPNLTRQVNRLTFAASGLEPFEFVQQRLLLKDRSREGIMLPAPGDIEWDLTLPEGATFRTFLAMIEAPLRVGRSDGVNVVLTIVDGEEETEIGRRNIQPKTVDFESWVVDLSQWGGKEVTVRLSSKIAKKDNHFDYAFLGAPVISGAPKDPSKVRRVLFVGLDTTRPDHLGFYGYDKATSPELDAFASDAIVFDRAWAPAPRTRPSFRTATTGRWPLDAVGATNIGQVFRDNGWATGGHVANIHLNPRFGFDVGFDLWRLDVQATASQQVDRALDFFKVNSQRDTFLFLHFMDPHLFYKAPAPYNDLFVDEPDGTLPKVFNRWQVVAWGKKSLTDKRKNHIEALYNAEIAYTSSELDRLFKGLEALGGQNLIVVHSDHGEEFWDHGGFEHNHTLYDELTRSVLVVRPPTGGGGYRVDTPVSLVDIGATLFDMAGIDAGVPQDGQSLRPLMEGKKGDQWKRPLQSAFLRYDRERWAVIVEGRHKYILHTGSGDEELYDLDSDPKEQENLADSTDLAPYRTAMANAYGVPVGLGWRLRLNFLRFDPVKFVLPKPAVEAGIFDPESLSAHRSNLAWGEVPKKSRADVGTVELSDDKMSFVFTPGPSAGGVLYVLFDEEVAPSGSLVKLKEDGTTKEMELKELKDGNFGWKEGANGA
ncbi:MAG: sulfatase, partial [Proteobacteria bacterium]|nr:sulfatase [Pseudomonadota bacterium]